MTMTMDVMSPEFWIALGTIIFIDIILAGDNAIVIGLAARKLPAQQQKKAIFWGTFGAVAIRAAATLLVVKLLEIPGLRLAGGLLLVWISYKLLINDEAHNKKQIQAKDSLWAAIWTIVIADAAMGLDNVIAIAGAAEGEPVLVVLGLIISVPIIVWGSTLFIRLINRFPPIIYIGSGVLAYTAGKMITQEPFVHHWFKHPGIYWGFVLMVTAGVLAAGKFKNSRQSAVHKRIESSSSTESM